MSRKIKRFIWEETEISPTIAGMPLAPIDYTELNTEIDNIQSNETQSADIATSDLDIEEVAFANINNNIIELPQFYHQSSFFEENGSFPGLFEENNAAYKFALDGSMLIDREDDGYPIIEVAPKNITSCPVS